MDPFPLAEHQAYSGDNFTRLPHMLPGDRDVWVAYLKSHDLSGWELYYDVHLGGGDDLPGDVSEGDGMMWRTLRSKRIDVVMRKRGLLWIVEVKPFASVTSLGQVIAYQHLWTGMFSGLPIPRTMVVSWSVDVELLDVFRSREVVVVALTVEKEGDQIPTAPRLRSR